MVQLPLAELFRVCCCRQALDVLHVLVQASLPANVLETMRRQNCAVTSQTTALPMGLAPSGEESLTSRPSEQHCYVQHSCVPLVFCMVRTQQRAHQRN